MSKKDNINITADELQETIDMLDAKISHVEDATMDNRELMIKLVKQGNEIVKFLRQLEVSLPEEELSGVEVSMSLPIEEERMNKFTHIKELIDSYMDRHSDLKELEKELSKYKDQLTPGQIGEA
tara:strand:+ start:214 stop:585 length:372 start_codon:yes stop_codon:yes gene_type:complete